MVPAISTTSLPWEQVPTDKGEAGPSGPVHSNNSLSSQEFGDHPNIIRLLDVIPAENDRDIYLVFESMGE